MPEAKPKTASTISLIGMPGAGKSTTGVLLAKLSGLRFVDTDLDIQVRAHATLQEILENQGYLHLRALEQEVLLGLETGGAIIATGGSVVYSEPVMHKLKAAGPVVYLEADLATLERRVAAAPPRGIASDAAQGYAAIYAERTPLYRQYADLSVDVGRTAPEAAAVAILKALKEPD